MEYVCFIGESSLKAALSPPGKADSSSRPDSQVGAGGANREKGEHSLLKVDPEGVQVAHILHCIEGHRPHFQV